MLDQIKDKDVRVYAIWVPILPFDGEGTVPNGIKRFTDGRVSHYWDGKGELVDKYARVLDLKDEEKSKEEGKEAYMAAWDMFLMFPRDAEWKDEPPKPSFWMHQIRTDKAERLNGEKFAVEVKKILETKK